MDRKSKLYIHRNVILICFFLVIATLVAYWQVQNNDFVNYDDDVYVTENYNIQAGFTRNGVARAFTSVHAANWHPLTWLSHMLDYRIYRLNPGGHHWTSLEFHILNTLLLFLVLRLMTGALWRSAAAAALFALHPLHVESVAWVAERKDVLSAFFWMLTMLAYWHYVNRPQLLRYLMVVSVFVLGLMSKPMLVTLPFVLLLLDYWPLERYGRAGSSDYGKTRSVALSLFIEKIPLFMLSAVSSAVTLWVQTQGGAVRSFISIPWGVRIANTPVSYVTYIKKMVWPSHLAVFYPHPGMPKMWTVATASCLIIAVTLIVVRLKKKHPYLIAGWLWYLGTLIPVIGLIQIGSQAMADRYTYLPLIGLFIMVAWGIPDLLEKWRYRKTVLAVSVITLLSIFMVCTWSQVRHWRNSITLFEHAIEVTSDNHIAHSNLGVALVREGRVSDAMAHYYEALRIVPDDTGNLNNLGIALMDQGKMDEALDRFRQLLRVSPDFAKAHNNLGLFLTRQGKTGDAVRHLQEAIRLRPDYAKAHNNLGIALTRQGRTGDAICHLQEAIRLRPNYVEAYNSLGAAYALHGNIEKAISSFTQALKLSPEYAQAHENLRAVLKWRSENSAMSKDYNTSINNH
jgi:Flp pilus assembly protein TadD